MDYFTNYVVCVPLRNKNGDYCGKSYSGENYPAIWPYGTAHSNGGGEFDNEILSEICRLTGVAKVKTTP